MIENFIHYLLILWKALGNTQERYDYLYTEEEMETWADRLRSLSAEVNRCYVFFNNCHMGKAALNAADMERLLAGSIGG